MSAVWEVFTVKKRGRYESQFISGIGKRKMAYFFPAVFLFSVVKGFKIYFVIRLRKMYIKGFVTLPICQLSDS